MTDTFETWRANLRQASETVNARAQAVRDAGEAAAEAEAFYRFEVGRVFKELRDAGEAVEAAKIGAHKACVVHSKNRDVTATNLKLAFEELTNAQDARRSLWRLIEWARGRDLATHGEPENVPRNAWP